MDKPAARHCAFLYTGESYALDRKQLMGRHAAGNGFLRGYIRHAGAESLQALTDRPQDQASFTALARDCGFTGRIDFVGADRLPDLRMPGTLFIPGPNLATLGWQRRRGGDTDFSVCGVTHTISSHVAMDAIADALSAPVYPWDGLVCTSRVVAASVERLWSAQEEWLAERFGSRPAQCRPATAVIPLGVDCDAMAPAPAARAHWRAHFGFAADDVVFLFLGRLSFHAKANPAPMYRALEAVARRGQAVRLLEAGWFANEPIERAFRDAAAEFCPSVPVHIVDGRQPDLRAGAWQAADVFISLSDNIQETFGLTPIEAMAAGLPGIVSDWDGYRDTVRDGIDGFRIPTVAPPPGLGTDLARLHEDGRIGYDQYIGIASQFAAVSPGRLEDACWALASSAERRRAMGNAARERAAQTFDWRQIVGQYQELFVELAARRTAAQRDRPPTSPRSLPRPSRPDPYWLFAEYPSGPLTLDQPLYPAGDSRDLGQPLRSPLLNVAQAFLPDADWLAYSLGAVAAAPGTTPRQLLAGSPAEAVGYRLRGLTWLIKAGLLEFLPKP